MIAPLLLDQEYGPSDPFVVEICPGRAASYIQRFIQSFDNIIRHLKLKPCIGKETFAPHLESLGRAL
jgi:hypothetical protein